MMDNVWQHYGLEKSPFANLLQPAQYYLPVSWNQRADLLLHLSRYSQVLLLLSGVEGSGKTCFLQKLLEKLEPSTEACRLQIDSELTPENILIALADQLKVALGKHQLDEQIAILLQKLQEAQRHVLWVIDDAHKLSNTTLSLLLTLIKAQSERYMPLAILLLGRSELARKLDQISGKGDSEDVIHSMPMEPFTLEETHEYLSHYFRAAGFRAELPLPSALVSRIHAQAEGFPGRLGMATEEVLTEVFNRKQGYAGHDLWLQHKGKIIIAAIVLVLLVFLAVFASQFSNLINPRRVSSINLPPKTQTIASANQQLNKLSAPKFPAATTTVNAEKIVTNEKKLIATEPQKQMSRVAPVSKVKQKITTVNPDKTLLKPSNTIDKLTIANQVIHPHLSMSMQAKIAYPRSTGILPLAADKTTIKKLPGNTQTKVKLKVKTPVSSYTADERALLAGDIYAYTLQLMGAYDKKVLENFKRTHEFAQSAHIYRSKHRGKTWYVLVYGRYQTRAQAKTAIGKLPWQVRKLKPWLRSLRSVQQAIKENN